MIAILFKKHNTNKLPGIGSNDYVVHAYPDCKKCNIDDVNEYYLEGYGLSSNDLDKITMHEVVTLMKEHTRMDLL